MGIVTIACKRRRKINTRLEKARQYKHILNTEIS